MLYLEMLVCGGEWLLQYTMYTNVIHMAGADPGFHIEGCW